MNITGKIASLDLTQSMVIVTNKEQGEFYFATLGGYGPLPDEIHTLITYHLAFGLDVFIELATDAEPMLEDMEAFISSSIEANRGQATQITGMGFSKSYADCLMHLDELKEAQKRCEQLS